MTEPVFITFEQVLRAHERSLQEYGGSAGVRDEGLLRSAVHHPLNDHFYGGADLFGIAAAYAFHIAQAQAFIDGNKRTAIAVALGFLELNGIAAPTNTSALYDAHDRHRGAPAVEGRPGAGFPRAVCLNELLRKSARLWRASAEH